MRRTVLALTLLGALVALGAAGCSAAPEPAPRSTPPVSSTPAPENPATPASASPVLDCLQGTWRLDSFAIEAGTVATTRGEGGGVTFGFTGDRWSLTGDEDEPMTVTMGSRTFDVVVDGSAAGTVLAGESGFRYAVEQTDGRVEVQLPPGSTSHGMPLEQFLASMVPTGGTEVDCDGDRASISSRNTSVNQVLRLTR